MTTYFVDTSALAKRYLNEIGSPWVISWSVAAAGNVIIISEATVVEIFSAFARRVREGTLPDINANLLRGNFLLHVDAEYLVAKIDSQLLMQARDLVTQYPLRTLDAIQLASAKQALLVLNEPITFVSSDSNLLLGAAAEGFTIDNPNLHP